MPPLLLSVPGLVFEQGFGGAFVCAGRVEACARRAEGEG